MHVDPVFGGFGPANPSGGVNSHSGSAPRDPLSSKSETEKIDFIFSDSILKQIFAADPLFAGYVLAHLDDANFCRVLFGEELPSAERLHPNDVDLYNEFMQLRMMSCPLMHMFSANAAYNEFNQQKFNAYKTSKQQTWTEWFSTKANEFKTSAETLTNLQNRQRLNSEKLDQINNAYFKAWGTELDALAAVLLAKKLQPAIKRTVGVFGLYITDVFSGLLIASVYAAKLVLLVELIRNFSVQSIGAFTLKSILLAPISVVANAVNKALEFETGVLKRERFAAWHEALDPKAKVQGLYNRITLAATRLFIFPIRDRVSKTASKVLVGFAKLVSVAALASIILGASVSVVIPLALGLTVLGLIMEKVTIVHRSDELRKMSSQPQEHMSKFDFDKVDNKNVDDLRNLLGNKLENFKELCNTTTAGLQKAKDKRSYLNAYQALTVFGFQLNTLGLPAIHQNPLIANIKQCVSDESSPLVLKNNESIKSKPPLNANQIAACDEIIKFINDLNAKLADPNFVPAPCAAQSEGVASKPTVQPTADNVPVLPLEAGPGLVFSTEGNKAQGAKLPAGSPAQPSANDPEPNAPAAGKTSDADNEKRPSHRRCSVM